MQTFFVNLAFFSLLHILTYFQVGAEAVSGRGECTVKYLMCLLCGYGVPSSILLP